MEARLIIKGSALHDIDVTEHPLHMLFLYKVAFMHQLYILQGAPKWIRNTSSERYLYTQVIGKQQPPSLWIDTGSDWTFKLRSLCNLWDWFRFAWCCDGRKKGEISAFIEKSCCIFFVSVGVIVVGLCHDKLYASSGNCDLAIFCNKNIYYLFFNKSFPLYPAHHLLLFS